jgi:hypothetical protein
MKMETGIGRSSDDCESSDDSESSHDMCALITRIKLFAASYSYTHITSFIKIINK